MLSFYRETIDNSIVEIAVKVFIVAKKIESRIEKSNSAKRQ